METDTKLTIKQAVLQVYKTMPEKFYISTMIQPVRTLMGAGRKSYDASIARKLRILNQSGTISYTASNKGVYEKLEVKEAE